MGCDSWLNQQNILINDLPVESCQNVAQVEDLLRRVNAVEKASIPWEERFAALEKLTQMEIHEEEKRIAAEKEQTRIRLEKEKAEAERKKKEEEKRLREEKKE